MNGAICKQTLSFKYSLKTKLSIYQTLDKQHKSNIYTFPQFYFILMNNQFSGGWGGEGGRQGGHHRRHNDSHHGGHHGHRERRGFEEGHHSPSQQGETRRHHGHHDWQRRHREGRDDPSQPPTWQANQTGYCWNYSYNPPFPKGDKFLGQDMQNSQIKISQMPKVSLASEVKRPVIEVKKEVNGSRQPPSYIVCPIAQTVMESPVLLVTCGHTFDKKQILDWFKRSKNCPICKSSSNQSHIIKNFSLVEAIDRYRCNN